MGRTDGLLIESSEVSKAIDKLVVLAEAGADCLYAPGVRNKRDISAMARAVAPDLLKARGMLRLRDFIAENIEPQTPARLVREEQVVRPLDRSRLVNGSPLSSGNRL